MHPTMGRFLDILQLSQRRSQELLPISFYVYGVCSLWVLLTRLLQDRATELQNSIIIPMVMVSMM